jgi:hypothetical protein
MKLEFSRQIFEKCSNIKFNKNPSTGREVVPFGRTDITNLIVVFRNFADAPKNAGTQLVKTRRKWGSGISMAIALYDVTREQEGKLTVW